MFLFPTYSFIGVSSITGFGMDKFMVAVQDGMKEYFEEYKVGRFLWVILSFTKPFFLFEK